MSAPTLGQKINGLTPGAFTTLCKVQPTGALQARKEASGAVALYWRYSIGTKSERVRIGLYDSSAPPKSLTKTASGYSVAAAIRAAEALAIQHHEHRDAGGRPALLAAERESRRTAEETAQRAAKNTLKSLLTDYCDHLQALGRRSHKDARSIFKLHIEQAWPEVAAQPASEVTGEQFADMMRRLIDAGKGRTANKLRSYARAAYQTAKAARSKPSIPVAFKAYGIRANPVADTEPDEQHNKPDKRPLSAQELRAYWQALKETSGFRGALLRLHLLTGGQRIEQLVNVKTTDIRNGVLTLMDGKGRPGKPARPHSIPITASAAKALAECAPAGNWALSTDGGTTHLAATTLSKWAAEVASAAGIEGFTAKRIRSGIETLLASARVSQEHRGRLQSHGVSGVQARHYDGHEYMEEKREALLTLQRLLDGKAGKASPPSAKAGRRRT
jgi:integrase